MAPPPSDVTAPEAEAALRAEAAEAEAAAAAGRDVHPGGSGAARRAAAGGEPSGGERSPQTAGTQPGLGAARRSVHHGSLHGAGRARLAPHPRRHLLPSGAGRRRRPGLRRPRAAARLLHEPPDGPAAPGHRRLLLPGNHLQPLRFPPRRLRTQAPGVEDHSPLRFRSHPHSPAVRHRHRILLLGLGADPGPTTAAQKIPRFPSLRHLRRQLLPGGGRRRSLHPRHRRQPAAALPHRGGGASPGAPLRDGGERTLPGRVRSDQPIPAAAGVHPLMPPAPGRRRRFLPLHFLGASFALLISPTQRKELFPLG